MKNFNVKTNIYYDDNALDRLYDIEAKKVFIVSDPFVVKSGMIENVTNRLNKSHIDYFVYDDVVSDPPIDKIISGVMSCVQYEPDTIIAIGGGSALDSAKAIKEFSSRIMATNSIRLIAIPTTSGTGSEVTSYIVLTDKESNKKVPIRSESMLPDEAILDVSLVKSVPKTVTADTGMDVFTHALESYVSTNHNTFTDALAEEAIELVGAFLLRSAFDNNDEHARKKMHIASTLAGLSFNQSGLGINHSLAHALGARFHIAHGRANAMLLPHIIEYNSEIDCHSKSKKDYKPVVERYFNIARFLGLENFNMITTVRALVSFTQFMNKELDIPLSISEMKICDIDEYMSAVDSMAKTAMQDYCTQTNPRIPTLEDIKNIYIKLW